MFSVPFRKQLRMASASAEVVGKFRFVWKNIRKMQVKILREYARTAEIAKKLNVKIPEPLINMEIEK